MADKRENLKKTLGIPEYPWSSDDEDNSSPVLSGHSAASDLSSMLRRVQASSSSKPQPSSSTPNSSFPGSSGQSSSQVRRPQATKIERNLFWSLVCNSNRRQMDPMSRSRATEGERHDSRTLGRRTDALLSRSGPLREIRDILALEKAARNHRSQHYVLPQSMAGRTLPTKNPLFTPAAASASRRGDRNKATSSMSVKLASWIPTTYESLRSCPAEPCPRSPPASVPSDPMDTEPSTSSGSARPRTISVGDAALDHDATTVVEDSDDVEMEIPRQTTRTESDQSGCSVITVAESPNVTTEIALEEEVLEVFPPDEHLPSADMADGNQRHVDAVQNPEVQPTDSGEVQNENRGVERKMDVTEVLKQFNQTLLRLLECPVCLEWMAPPMSQCRRGHLVCVSCRARLSACPVCRTAFSSVRNRAMESVAEVLRYPCRHGCGREVRLRRRGGHEASCPRRRYPCPAPACSKRAPLDHAALDQHLQTKHLPMLKFGKKHRFSIKVNAEQHDNWMILALREIFHLRIDVDIRTWGVAIYVAYIGPKNNAKTYSYEVTVIGKHDSRTLVYTRATHSDLESASLNVSRQDCFYLTLDQALNFLRMKNRHCETDNLLSVSIGISKNEVEAGKEEDSCDS